MTYGYGTSLERNILETAVEQRAYVLEETLLDGYLACGSCATKRAGGLCRRHTRISNELDGLETQLYGEEEVWEQEYA